ncbi:hypothetical protein [Actinoplanes sp. RD1]|uniref:hypothetical protein n=1 Tax=Actinoplanes sp. RD1 TaxID=3064538 RepID=UPI0027423CF9|nr:hypothetical protein [Actinoplanes sp. RD1]
MSTLEDRLRSTLTARAELVTAERLSPAVPPTAQAPVRSRRPAILAVVLATVAVALVAVVMLTPDPVRRPAPQPPAGPVPSPSV